MENDALQRRASELRLYGLLAHWHEVADALGSGHWCNGKKMNAAAAVLSAGSVRPKSDAFGICPISTGNGRLAATAP